MPPERSHFWTNLQR